MRKEHMIKVVENIIYNPKIHAEVKKTGKEFLKSIIEYEK